MKKIGPYKSGWRERGAVFASRFTICRSGGGGIVARVGWGGPMKKIGPYKLTARRAAG